HAAGLVPDRSYSCLETFPWELKIEAARGVVRRVRALARTTMAKPLIGPRLPTDGEWITARTRVTW
ncbi:hypothetical protein FRB97_002090, partial [Tulasnella sp. 331]